MAPISATMSSGPHHTEKELLLLIAEGNEEAFRKLFSIYIPFLQPSIKKLVKDPAMVDDILQEVFLRIWVYRDKLPAIESPRSWVLRIAYNRAFTWLGKQEKNAARPVSMEIDLQAASTETEEQLAFQALKDLLAKAVDQLPPQQRRIYLLSRNSELNMQEIADQLGISVHTVKNALGKALQSIRAYIEGSGYPMGMVLIFFLSFFYPE